MAHISIIIPIYKVEQKFLRPCLDALLVQTMQESEFILVSDGAPDEECFICEEYVRKDSRFKFFKRKHEGVSATRNYGIKQAHGEYIAFVDGDDKITDFFCEKIYNKVKEWNSDILLFEHTFDKNKTDFCYSLYNHDIPKLSLTQYKDLLSKLYFPNNNNDGLILAGICCKAYRRSFIENNNLKFETILRYSEDQFFCLNAFLKTNNISYLSNSPFYIQSHRPNSASSSYKAGYEKEVCIYLENIRHIAETNSNLIKFDNFYDRTIQCILYTLDKCIFRPDKKISLKKRRLYFLDFVNTKNCKESLLQYNKNHFSKLEKVICFLCKKKAFWILLLISKKWHIQRYFKNRRSH